MWLSMIGVARQGLLNHFQTSLDANHVMLKLVYSKSVGAVSYWFTTIDILGHGLDKLWHVTTEKLVAIICASCVQKHELRSKAWVACVRFVAFNCIDPTAWSRVTVVTLWNCAVWKIEKALFTSGFRLFFKPRHRQQEAAANRQFHNYRCVILPIGTIAIVKAIVFIFIVAVCIVVNGRGSWVLWGSLTSFCLTKDISQILPHPPSYIHSMHVYFLFVLVAWVSEHRKGRFTERFRDWLTPWLRKGPCRA